MSIHTPCPLPAPPSGCAVILQRHADGLTLTIPPLGLRRGAGPLFWLTAIWMGMAVVFSVLFYPALATGNLETPGPKGLWYLFPLPFLAVSVILAMVVWHLGRRQAAIDVCGDRLTVIHSGLFGIRRGEWSRDELAAICAGPSGVVTNGVPDLQLQIRPQSGPMFAMFSGWPHAELRWMAEVLGLAVGVGAAPPALGGNAESAGGAAADAGDHHVRPGFRGPPAWLGPPVACGLFFTFVRITLGDLALVDHLVWPWSAWYVWTAGGLLVGGLIAVVLEVARAKHGRALQLAAESLGFSYHAAATRSDLGEAGRLPLFDRWHRAAHRMGGRVNGVAVEMLDYTDGLRAGGDRTHHRQTVILLSAGGSSRRSNIPEESATEGGSASRIASFVLRPQAQNVGILHALRDAGITFSAQTVGSEEDRDAVERFGRQYHLSEEPAAGAERFAPSRLRGAAQGTGETAIRELFSIDLLRSFADRPGWHVECNGRYVAIWRRGKVVAGKDRSQFLADALDVLETLTRPARHRSEPLAPGAGPGWKSVLLPSVGAVAGGIAGFAGGTFLGLSGVRMLDAHAGGVHPLGIVLFFGGPLLGAAIGGLIGSRWIAARLRKRSGRYPLR